jgi:hypothetical protein
MKTILFFCTLILIQTVSGLALSNGPSKPPGDLVIFKEDENNTRLFIKANEPIIENLSTIIEIIKSARTYIYKNKPHWGDKWSLSFFAEKKYAAYKDDETVRDYVVNGSWGRNYLAEYSNSEKILVRYPVNYKKRLKNQIKLD